MTVITSKASFNRPANTTAYADGDLVANDTTAGNVVPLTFSVARLGKGSGVIRRVRLFKDDETVTNANFTLHLFAQDPSVNVGDNAALDSGTAYAVDTARHFLGSVAIDMSSGAFPTSTDLAEAVAPSPAIYFDLNEFGQSERRLFGLLEANAAYGPASGELFEVTLDISEE